MSISIMSVKAHQYKFLSSIYLQPISSLYIYFFHSHILHVHLAFSNTTTITIILSISQTHFQLEYCFYQLVTSSNIFLTQILLVSINGKLQKFYLWLISIFSHSIIFHDHLVHLHNNYDLSIHF
jgi:hypothetical protein